MPSDAPLADAVDRFLADPGTTFTVPGHKRAPGIADPLLLLDLPLVSGADDSRLSGDVLGRAERAGGTAVGRRPVPVLGGRHRRTATRRWRWPPRGRATA